MTPNRQNAPASQILTLNAEGQLRRRFEGPLGTKPTSPGHEEASASRGKADITRTGGHFRV